MKPNILLIVIDSLRTDRIFGKQKTASSPNIDSLIKKGVYFSNAITTSQYTSQVMTSIFTARFLLGDGTTKKPHTKIHSTSTSLLSLLKNNGYNTSAIAQEDVFLQGLKETFDNEDISFKSEDNLYNGLGERILKKLDSITSPWFYYIHLEDLHAPCAVPEELGHLKLTERYDRNIFEIDSLIGKILKKINLYETIIVITSDHGEYVSPIQGPLKESTNTKVAIKNSIKKLLPRTILIKLHIKKRILVGKIQASKTNIPHEKRILAYGKQLQNKVLFDDIVHVPLLFAGYNINSMPSITQQICNIDIFPTILELIGIPITIQNLYGRSLVPLLKGKELDSIPIYMTSLAIIKELYMSMKMEKFSSDYSSNPLVGIRTQNFKYFRNAQDPKKDVHLYDLKNDPLEDNNIANERPDIVKEMELNIEKIKKDTLPLSNEGELGEEEIKIVEESLKRLGYI